MATKSIIAKKSRPLDKLMYFFIYLSAALTVSLVLFIIIYVFVRGLPGISWKFLTTAPSSLRKTIGILPAIINTLYIIAVTLVIVTPIGVGAAIYLNEYAKKGSLVRLIESTTEILTGIPSIVYGLFGAIFFGDLLDLGYSIMTGALTLSIMTLPIIIRTTEEALKTVPASYREGALGIGATKWYMIRTIILPSAMPGIVTAIILSIGRIVGESAALLFTSGVGSALPKSFFGHLGRSGATLTVQMYEYASRGVNLQYVFSIAVVLMIIVFIINTLTRVLTKKLNRGTM